MFVITLPQMLVVLQSMSVMALHLFAQTLVSTTRTVKHALSRLSVISQVKIQFLVLYTDTLAIMLDLSVTTWVSFLKILQ